MVKHTNKKTQNSWKQWMHDEIAKDQAKLILINKNQLVSDCSSSILLSEDSSRQLVPAASQEISHQSGEQ